MSHSKIPHNHHFRTIRSTLRTGQMALTLLCAMIVGLTAQANDLDQKKEILRYASLRSDTVNMRVGPSDDYPINWIYKQRGWPVAIISEYDNWRMVRDADGIEGWIFSTLLSTTRTAVVTRKTCILRQEASDGSAPRAKLMKGLIVNIQKCESGWCRINVSGHEGYVKTANIWGATEQK